MKLQLIAFDLDDTYLNTAKTVPEENRRALEEAHNAGAFIVPATGRFFDGMPAEVRALPFVRYAITINGAVVYDLKEQAVIAHHAMPLALSLELMAYLDTVDVIYDCYMVNEAFMTRSLWEKVEEYIESAYYRERVRTLRTPVDSLPAFVKERGEDLSKIQLFAKDQALRLHLLEDLARRYPAFSVTTSLPDNIEITAKRANKGEALQALADNLGIPMEHTFGIGDGLNDVTLLQMAGRGVAMGSAPEALKAVADEVTEDCDHGGFADALIRALREDDR